VFLRKLCYGFCNSNGGVFCYLMDSKYISSVYRIIKGGEYKMDRKQIIERAKALACHTRMWWQNHHRKENDDLLFNMARVEVLRSGFFCPVISQKEAEVAVGYQVQAAFEHDVAERFEDSGNQAEADIHWIEVEKLLEKYFLVLLQYAE
ncbi:MAG: hypothetical protein U9Q27_00780, partial [Patescibacteria group bacterium]|nr:hypothetical protein [Patescibacteria group bacterium]